MNTDLTGFRDLDEKLKELPKATAKNVLRRAAMTAMKRIEDRAKQLVPVDQGEVRDSITTKNAPAVRVSRGRFAAKNSVEVWTGPAGREEGGNAAWQEFGTVKMTPHPYMRPAADTESEAVIDDVREELTKQIDKAAARMARKAARAG